LQPWVCMRTHRARCLLALGLSLLLVSVSQACGAQDFDEALPLPAAGSGGQFAGAPDASSMGGVGGAAPKGGPKYKSCVPEYCFPMDGKLNCLPVLCLLSSLTTPSPISKNGH